MKSPAKTTSNALSDLSPVMEKMVEKLLLHCERRGFLISLFATLRGPETQGKMWCQSRTVEEIQIQASLLRKSGAPTMASYLRPEWALTGRWATDNLPGNSWHQWGEACDCVLVVGGKAVWNSNFYTTTYAELAKKVGLECGAAWSRGRDKFHLQARKLESPMKMFGLYTWVEIEEKMLDRFQCG